MVSSDGRCAASYRYEQTSYFKGPLQFVLP